MTLDPITEAILNSWEAAGELYAISAREVRAELEAEEAAA